MAYLVAALDVPLRERCTIYEIGGADRVSYGGMMQAYARAQHVRRPMIKLPWLTPRLSSGWLALVTPLYFRVGRHLLEGVRNETVVTSDASARDFPQIRPMGIDAAIAAPSPTRTAPTPRRAGATPAPTAPPPKHWPAARFGRRYVDQRTVDVPCPPARRSRPCSASAGARAGTPGPGSGACAACWTRSAAAWARAAAAATPPASSPGTPWTSGAWRLGAGPAAPPGGRDAHARPRLAAVRADPAAGRADAHRADRHVGPGGSLRPVVLVLALAPARDHLPRHDPRHSRGERLPASESPTPFRRSG